MAKKKHPEHVNHERWLVSYADFITLLFAFFVVMFATSQTDSVKVTKFVDSFTRAIQWSVFSVDGTGFLEGAPSNPSHSDEKIESAKPTKSRPRSGEREHAKEIKGAVKQLQASAPILSGLKIEEAQGELVLRLPERLVFDRGQAELKEEGRIALTAIADELAPRPVKLRVEGHTDSVPIHTARFPSNWELSTARATAVIQFFIEKKDFDASRLSAAGYAEFHPVADNDTEEGRALNRRVDLVITEALEGIGNQYLAQKVKAEKRADEVTAPTVLPALQPATPDGRRTADAPQKAPEAPTRPHEPTAALPPGTPKAAPPVPGKPIVPPKAGPPAPGVPPLPPAARPAVKPAAPPAAAAPARPAPPAPAKPTTANPGPTAAEPTP